MKLSKIILLAILSLLCSAQQSFADPEKQTESKTKANTPGLHITPDGKLLREELPIGDYQQPEWTVRRPFAQTRVYVLPAWHVGGEAGWDGTFPGGAKPQHVIQEELEIGLPHRFQIDLENHDQRGKFIPEKERKDEEGDTEAENDSWGHKSNGVELSYALADWGVIPLNPVIKGEWKFNHDAADAYEAKLLLGEELASRWHWATNLFFEQQIGDKRERELAMSQAVAYTAIDELLNLGIEMKLSSESESDNRSKAEAAFAIGPTMQIRPTKESHIDIVPLFGIGEAAPQAEVLVFVGFDLDASGKENEISEPASLRGK